jgi:hypothetical protein
MCNKSVKIWTALLLGYVDNRTQEHKLAIIACYMECTQGYIVFWLVLLLLELPHKKKKGVLSLHLLSYSMKKAMLGCGGALFGLLFCLPSDADPFSPIVYT